MKKYLATIDVKKGNGQILKTDIIVIKAVTIRIALHQCESLYIGNFHEIKTITLISK